MLGMSASDDGIATNHRLRQRGYISRCNWFSGKHGTMRSVLGYLLFDSGKFSPAHTA